eukprot:GHVP01000961.1.p1 GENE.GHVP01000961.1~~GHVP01000961.1.p1  ORF type:complete len:137 (-),score=28.41 GHVP01000961.1:125-535(-)
MNFLFALKENLTAEDLENLINRFGYPVPSQIKEIHHYFVEELRTWRMDLTEQIEMLCVCIEETGLQVETEGVESGIEGFINSQLPPEPIIVPGEPYIKKKWVRTFNCWNKEFREASPYSRLRSAFEKGNICHYAKN